MKHCYVHVMKHYLYFNKYVHVMKHYYVHVMKHCYVHVMKHCLYLFLIINNNIVGSEVSNPTILSSNKNYDIIFYQIITSITSHEKKINEQLFHDYINSSIPMMKLFYFIMQNVNNLGYEIISAYPSVQIEKQNALSFKSTAKFVAFGVLNYKIKKYFKNIENHQNEKKLKNQNIKKFDIWEKIIEDMSTNFETYNKTYDLLLNTKKENISEIIFPVVNSILNKLLTNKNKEIEISLENFVNIIIDIIKNYFDDNLLEEFNSIKSFFKNFVNQMFNYFILAKTTKINKKVKESELSKKIKSIKFLPKHEAKKLDKFMVENFNICFSGLFFNFYSKERNNNYFILIKNIFNHLSFLDEDNIKIDTASQEIKNISKKLINLINKSNENFNTNLTNNKFKTIDNNIEDFISQFIATKPQEKNQIWRSKIYGEIFLISIVNAMKSKDEKFKKNDPLLITFFLTKEKKILTKDEIIQVENFKNLIDELEKNEIYTKYIRNNITKIINQISQMTKLKTMDEFIEMYRKYLDKIYGSMKDYFVKQIDDFNGDYPNDLEEDNNQEIENPFNDSKEKVDDLEAKVNTSEENIDEEEENFDINEFLNKINVKNQEISKLNVDVKKRFAIFLGLLFIIKSMNNLIFFLKPFNDYFNEKKPNKIHEG